MALTRSQQMARIRARDTSPEMVIRRRLYAAGLRFRLHSPTPGGKADVVIPREQFALFIDGCFWHGCPDHYVRPRSRNEFWDKKLSENVSRDRRQTLALQAAGWKLLRVWEHEVVEDPERVVERILAIVRTGSASRRQRDWRVVRVEVLDPELDLERRHLEDLRRPELKRFDERRRSTRKVGKPGSVRTRIRPPSVSRT